jgi:hypothetical protein
VGFEDLNFRTFVDVYMSDTLLSNLLREGLPLEPVGREYMFQTVKFYCGIHEKVSYGND